MAETTSAARYSTLETERQAVLDRARECSALTLPTLIPPQGSSQAAEIATPYQSVGAQGVIALAAKILTTILPPNNPFFRLSIEELALRELSKQQAMRAEVEEALAMVERITNTSIETSNIRVSVHEALLHLIVGGNALVFKRPKNMGVRVYGLSNYVALRDPSGAPIEIIAKEEVARAALPTELQNLLPISATDSGPGSGEAQKNHSLYTHLVRTSDVEWSVTQSLDDTPVPGSEGKYPVDTCPWLPLRWNSVDGESYGRGHVEAYLGDIKTLEALSKALTEYAVGAAKVIPLVNPNGVTDEEDLSKADNFEFVSGVADDVSFVRIEKYADMQVAKGLADDITERLARFFLMGSSIQRRGERVTAEEIRYMATELEQTIGGVYAVLAQELQLPLVRIIMADLTREKRIPKLPKGIVSPLITTGLDALSRANDLTKLDQMMGGLRDLYGPEAMAQETNVGDYIKRRAAALGLDIDGLIKSPEQKQAEQQQRMQMEMMNRLGPNAINQIGGLAKAGMEQPQ
jgi:hypothetical protein